MNENLSHILVVEGSGDRDFFTQLLSKRSDKLNLTITVATSKDFSPSEEGKPRKDTKEDVFKLLPTLLKRFPRGKIERLGIVVDADKPEHCGACGYSKTVSKFEEILGRHGFNLNQEESRHGLIFSHPDFFDIGVWIMPNNQDDGILEDFITSCIHKDEETLFNHAKSTVNNLSEPKFAKHHFSKAEVATWMAWQKPPGRGIYAAVEDNLLDTTHDNFKKLMQWLTQVFKA